jgi:peptidoglycan/xylan/chitin deacetylase (PgdA/CDA1 family)
LGEKTPAALFHLWSDALEQVIGDQALKQLCLSIDVERDYRTDGKMTTRGVREGLPAFVELLESRRIPFDLFVSGEVIDSIPRNLVQNLGGLIAVGCHGLHHRPGLAGYLNRLSLESQRAEIATATDLIEAKLGRKPYCFRAPNFSSNGQTLGVLRELGYRVDSSVLPGRLVRKFRVWTLLDQRGAPLAPYFPDRNALARPGSFPLLEVPVTPSLSQKGSPLGLGLLNDLGPDVAARDALQSAAQYVVFLCHSWEMVDWTSDAPVVPWVRRAASGNLAGITRFVEALHDTPFVNIEGILASETRTAGSLRS